MGKIRTIRRSYDAITARDVGFVRIATAVPVVHLANPDANVVEHVTLIQQAMARGVEVMAFPELSLTGYTCMDLHRDPELRTAAIRALKTLIEHECLNQESSPIVIVGLPLAIQDGLYNVAAVCSQGKIIGMVPKSMLPNYGEFEEGRWFKPADTLLDGRDAYAMTLFDDEPFPVGVNMLFRAVDPKTHQEVYRFGIEICEDAWVPIPPSMQRVTKGARIIFNLSGSNSLTTKNVFRESMVSQLSARGLCAYAYVSSGFGESSKSLVFDGHSMICENGAMLRELPRWQRVNQLLVADIDNQFLEVERLRTTSFLHGAEKQDDPVPVSFDRPKAMKENVVFERDIDPDVFVPKDPAKRVERCQEVIEHMRRGLSHHLWDMSQRRQNQPIDVSIGISGGLDSTLALLVTVLTFDELNWDRKGIKAKSMPSEPTSNETRTDAKMLCRALNVDFEEIPIIELTKLLTHLAHHEACFNCWQCENAQARARTTLLMTFGNFVVGTGDMSEIALGWCTYNGDHMSMYNPNASVPKSLVRWVVQTAAELPVFAGTTHEAIDQLLQRVGSRTISPELRKPNPNGEMQSTESLVGPYDLNDFYLFHSVRRSSSVAKLLFLAQRAFANRYPSATLNKWLRNYHERFQGAQWKRECVPNGPKIGSVSLDPRGDLRLAPDSEFIHVLRAAMDRLAI